MSQNRRNRREFLSILLSIVLIIAGAILLLANYQILSDNILFYLGVSFVFLGAIVSLTMVSNDRWRFKLLIILSFVCVFHLLRGGVLQDPTGRTAILETDVSRELRLTSLIIEKGHWQSGMGIERMQYFSYYPLMFVWGAIFSSVTGVSFELLAGLIFRLISILPLIFFFYSVRHLTEDTNLSLWSTFILSLNEQIFFFDSEYSYESMAIIFFAMILLFLCMCAPALSRRTKTMSLLSLTFTSIVALALTHLWTSVNLILLLIVLLFLSVARTHFKETNGRVFRAGAIGLDLKLVLLLALVAILAYNIFVAYNVFDQYAIMGKNVFSNLVLPTEASSPQAFMGFQSYEKGLVYAGLLLLAFYGFVRLSKGFKSRDLDFFDSLFIVGGCYLAILVFFLPITVPKDIAHRGWIFAFVLMAPTIARGFIGISRQKQLLKYVCAVSMLLPVLSATLIIGPQVYLPPSNRINYESYASGTWVAHFVVSGSETIVMPIVNDAISPYGMLEDVGRTFGGQQYYEKTFSSLYSGSISEAMRGAGCNYLFVDEDFNKTLQENTWFLWSLSLILQRSKTPVDNSYLVNLNSGPQLQKVYDNQVIGVYTLSNSINATP